LKRSSQGDSLNFRISMMENAGLTGSMSKKGCSFDNSAFEGFFEG